MPDPMLILFTLVLSSCSGGDPAGLDSGTTDSGPTEALDWCADPGQSSGTAAGTADCTDTVCEVPAGSFWMGDPEPDHPDQCPRRLVTLSAYAIDRTEVTWGAYALCVDAGACTALRAVCEGGAPDQDPDLVPARCATWNQAEAYCAWTGGTLPTEAQWERAARGDDGALWPWGAEPPTCNRANFHFSTSYCAEGPLEVGSFPDWPSPWGLLDVSGNVWEWTANWYSALAYRTASDTDPTGPAECASTVDGDLGTCTTRVLRGGAYNTTEFNTRTGARSFGAPDLVDENIGFRCAYPR